MRNERGIALIMTMLVVTLLTIAVVEFTYSVQVDQQLTRNALSAMQAAMLARSGINLGEAVLARDTNDPPADWYFEDWANPDIASVITLDPDQRLKVEVIDEAGKININRTRPAPTAVLRPGQPTPVPNAPASGQPGQQPNVTPDAFLRDAMRALFQESEVRVDIVDQLREYWEQQPPPQPGRQQQLPTQVEDFRSLEDFGATFGIPAAKLTKLSKFLTALPTSAVAGVGRDPGLINVNTAPPKVLLAILNDAARVDQIVQRREGEQPIVRSDLNEILQGIENQGVLIRLFGFTTSFFRIYSSAMVNADPTGERLSGVGQTVVALVQRRPMAGVPPNAPPGTPRWTLTPLDWQKRGGAELLTRPPQPDNEQETAGMER